MKKLNLVTRLGMVGLVAGLLSGLLVELVPEPDTRSYLPGLVFGLALLAAALRYGKGTALRAVLAVSASTFAYALAVTCAMALTLLLEDNPLRCVARGDTAGYVGKALADAVAFGVAGLVGAAVLAFTVVPLLLGRRVQRVVRLLALSGAVFGVVFGLLAWLGQVASCLDGMDFFGMPRATLVESILMTLGYAFWQAAAGAALGVGLQERDAWR